MDDLERAFAEGRKSTAPRLIVEGWTEVRVIHAEDGTVTLGFDFRGVKDPTAVVVPRGGTAQVALSSQGASVRLKHVMPDDEAAAAAAAYRTHYAHTPAVEMYDE